MVWTNAGLMGIRDRGIDRRRVEPGGSYQRSPLSSAQFPPGSSVVKALPLSQQVRVLFLLLHEFLRFTKQACYPLQHGRVLTVMFALTKGRA